MKSVELLLKRNKRALFPIGNKKAAQWRLKGLLMIVAMAIGLYRHESQRDEVLR